MNNTDKRYEIDMVNGPILKKMLLFTIPLMFSSILQLVKSSKNTVGEIVQKEVDFLCVWKRITSVLLANLFFWKKNNFYRQDFSFTL